MLMPTHTLSRRICCPTTGDDAAYVPMESLTTNLQHDTRTTVPSVYALSCELAEEPAVISLCGVPLSADIYSSLQGRHKRTLMIMQEMLAICLPPSILWCCLLLLCQCCAVPYLFLF